MNTEAPSAANASAVASPIPLVPPVTTTTLFSNLAIVPLLDSDAQPTSVVTASVDAEKVAGAVPPVDAGAAQSNDRPDQSASGWSARVIRVPAFRRRLPGRTPYFRRNAR